MRQLLVTAGLLLPLGLDTLALSAALGVAGLSGRDRLRVSLLFTAFEAGMPVAFFLGAHATAGRVGQWAGYVAVAFLLLTAVPMLIRRDDDASAPQRSVRLLARARGPALILLGLSISWDEAGIGISAGFLGLPIALVVPWIALQAYAAAQLGMRFGGRVGESLRERSEQAAAVALILVALVLLALQLLRIQGA
jgi:putative Mn2+ efflux pump MntP